jgi:hypothetical protein
MTNVSGNHSGEVRFELDLEEFKSAEMCGRLGEQKYQPLLSLHDWNLEILGSGLVEVKII